MFLILLLMGMILYEVVARYVFNSPTFWAMEGGQMVFGAYFILVGGYILLHGGHVNMEVVYVRLPSRQRAILDLISSSLFFIFCGLLLWKGAQLAWTSVQIGECSQSSWAPPLYPIKLCIAIGAFLMLLQGLAKFIRDLAIAWSKVA